VLTGTSGTTDAATVTAAGTVGLDTAGTQQIETVNLSGNGAAATFTITGAPTTTNLTGSQSVTLSGDEASFDGKTLNDNTTAGTTTVKLTTLDTSDLSKIRADVINLAADPAGDTYTFANGQSVILTAAVPTADFTVDIDDQTTAYTNGSITVELANVVSSAVTAFASGLGIVVAATSATSDNISTLNIVNNTIAQTALEVLATADTNLVLSGSKAVVLQTATTAKTISATGLTAALTVNYDGTNDVATVTGGAANDTFAIATGYNGGSITIDGGAGVGDTVTVAEDETLSAVTFNNIEVINIADTKIQTFKASQLSGKSYVFTGSATTGTGEAIVIGTAGPAKQIDTATIDLSQLVIDTTNITKFTVLGTDIADTLSVASPLTITGSTTKDSITGGGGADSINGGLADDTLIGGAGADTILGGAGSDAITGGTGVDSLTGGDGVDTFYLTATALNGLDVITDFGKATATSPDVLSISLTGYAGTTGTTGYISALVDGNSASVSDSATLLVKVVSAATTVAAGDNIFSLTGSFADSTAVLTAIQSGGSRALTFGSSTAAAGKDILVVWSDGTLGHVSVVNIGTAATTIGAGTLADAANTTSLTDLVTLTGVTTIASGDFLAANFDLVA
jgi:hypothetical protein